MPAVGGGAFADIDSNIQYGTFDTPYKFGLSEGWKLEMKSAHHPFGRHRFIVLNEVDGAYFLIKFLFVITLKEISACILEYTRLDDHYAIYIGLDYFHKQF